MHDKKCIAHAVRLPPLCAPGVRFPNESPDLTTLRQQHQLPTERHAMRAASGLFKGLNPTVTIASKVLVIGFVIFCAVLVARQSG
jgi:hypothetical protein